MTQEEVNATIYPGVNMITFHSFLDEMVRYINNGVKTDPIFDAGQALNDSNKQSVSLR